MPVTLATHIANHTAVPAVWEIYGGGLWIRIQARCGKMYDAERCVSPADATCQACRKWLDRNNELLREAVVDAHRHGLGAETARDWRP
jgi:hypothetical protein